MTNPAAALNELIEITRDGQTFYTDAVTRVTNPHLKSVFRALIDVKSTGASLTNGAGNAARYAVTARMIDPLSSSPGLIRPQP